MLTLDQCKAGCLKEKDEWNRSCKAIEMKRDTSSCSLMWGCEKVKRSRQYNVFVWRNTTCRDDPYGIVAEDPDKECAKLKRTGIWSCLSYDRDFNGHSVWIWELCPKSCKLCDKAGLECDEKNEGCDESNDRMEEHQEHHYRPPPRPTPECRIREDCRWCDGG